MNKENLIKNFKEKWLAKAQEYIQSPEKIKALLPKIIDYLSKKGLSEVKEYILIFVDYLTDIVNGRYKDYNVTSLLMIVAAMIYLISPIDVIPDFILVLGLIDDVAIIGYVFSEVSVELDRYKEWKKNNQ